jgi:hypothetical protein
MTTECFTCGNKKEEELEYKTVILDDCWKEVKKKVWVCKDQYDCGMRMFGNKN